MHGKIIVVECKSILFQHGLFIMWICIVDHWDTRRNSDKIG